MNDKTNLIDDDIPAHKKKSKNKGLPRSKHKHIYETVLLIRDYHITDCKTGKPKVTQCMQPTKVCIICGRIDEVDKDESLWEKHPDPNVKSWMIWRRELSEKALALPKWHCDFLDKFAVKMELESDES